MISKAKEFFIPGEQRRRLLMTFAGLAICAMSGGFMKRAALGSDPFQTFCNGLELVLPISFGAIHVIISVILLAVILKLDRHFIGIGTCLNLCFTGYIVDLTYQALGMLFPAPSMALRIALLIIGLIAMCFSASLYFTADLGVSTYDFVALYIAKIQKKVPFRLVRIGTDLICVLAGFAMGYAPGVGTLITACFMGPLISYFNRTVSEPMRSGAKRRS